MSEMREGLMACPLCGSVDVGCREWGYAKHDVACNTCGCSTDYMLDDFEAIEAWNSRPREDALQAKLDEAKAFHPRAMHLIEKQQNFVVVANNEPYFAQVYALIREDRMKTSRWSVEDEKIYQQNIKELES